MHDYDVEGNEHQSLMYLSNKYQLHGSIIKHNGPHFISLKENEINLYFER